MSGTINLAKNPGGRHITSILLNGHSVKLLSKFIGLNP